MSVKKKLQGTESYFDLDAWRRALNNLNCVNVLLIEFHRKQVGKVKRVCGTVVYKFRQPVGTDVLEQTTLIDVAWKHNGICYERGSRRPEYDVDKFLGL